jgi:hypothetical protein
VAAVAHVAVAWTALFISEEFVGLKQVWHELAYGEAS